MQHVKVPLDYPSHPFDIEYCDVLSRLPQGLCDLGLTARLSTQMITVLEYLWKYVRICSVGPADESESTFLSTYQSGRLLQDLGSFTKRMALKDGSILPVEANLVFALPCFIAQLFNVWKAGKLWQLYKESLVRSLCSVQLEDEPRVLTWCRVIALVSCSDRKRSRTYARIFMELQRIQLLDTNWEDLRPLMQDYFWIAELDGVWECTWSQAQKKNRTD